MSKKDFEHTIFINGSQLLQNLHIEFTKWPCRIYDFLSQNSGSTTML